MLSPHPEECHGGATLQGSVRDFGLLCKVRSVFYRGDHPLHCEEGRQVGCVGRDDDEGKEPPDASNDTR